MLTSNLNLPARSWIISDWWTKGGIRLSPGTMDQVFRSTIDRIAPPVLHSRAQKVQIGTVDVPRYLSQHGYTQWTSYQPGSRFWPFQWIEGGWLLALLVAATVWLVRRRAA